MTQLIRISSLALLIVAGSTQLAPAAVVNFELDPVGPKGTTYTSVDSPILHFTDSLPDADGLWPDDWFADGNISLAIFGDDASELIMTFDVLVNAISLAFGNDDPGFVALGDLGRLTLFNGLVQVGQVDVALNGNDAIDQTIAFSGSNFDRATFVFTNSAGIPLGLAEFVDNIDFTPAASAAVPEPVSLAIWGAGAVGMAIAGVRRRRQQRAA